MTRQEKDLIMKIIVKHMHTDFLGNGACKTVLDTNALPYVSKELEEMIDNDK